MKNLSHYKLFVALADVVGRQDKDAGYILQALAGCAGCGDTRSLRVAVQQWVSDDLEASAKKLGRRR